MNELEREIGYDLEEWTRMITELSDKEVELFKCKTVKGELKDLYDEIKSLEFSIDYINRRIMFLKELIRTKRTLMEIKE